LTYTENDQLKCWPDLPVVVDDMRILQPFIDSVQHKPERESLVRFKITHLPLSSEYVLGTSFYHMIGDANTKIRFLNDLSRIYQHLEPVLPRPIFERKIIKNENVDYSLPNIIDLSKNAGRGEILLDCLTKEHSETDTIQRCPPRLKTCRCRTAVFYIRWRRGAAAPPWYKIEGCRAVMV